jgi:glycosyltransferase involved in cell wall biosynthesis
VDGRTARIVPTRNAEALAAAIVTLMDDPAERARLAAAAHDAGRQYGIDAFVRKMERLYTLLANVSRRTKRQGILTEDLSFLEGGVRS